MKNSFVVSNKNVTLKSVVCRLFSKESSSTPKKECIRMSFDTDWDVDKYKTEHECDEHWELRRSFMLEHKEKFPENRLVCLAQVFTNIEFLGCRYPAETMHLVGGLSEGVVDTYREKQKGRLQRTFVQASDAAGAKAKGLKRPLQGEGPSESMPSDSQKKSRDFDSKSIATLDAGLQTNFNSKSQGNSSRMAQVTYGPAVCTAAQSQNSQSSSFANGSSRFGSSRYGGVKTYHIDKTSTGTSPQTAVPVIGGPFGKLVLIEQANKTVGPMQTIHESTAMCQVPLRCEYDQRVSPEVSCSIYVNGILLATSLGANRKLASRTAAEIALEKLKETCYTIKMKLRFWSDSTIDKSLGTTCNSDDIVSADVNVPVSDDSVGNRLLRLMGWSGGGLGKDAQGIEEPVSIKEHVNRAGLGLSQPKSGGSDDRQFREKVQRLIRDYANGNSQYDLVFSPEFTTEERKTMHTIATRFKLKTKSYGRNEDRHLVISKKKEMWQVFEQLLRSGGSTERYDLIKPTSPECH